MRAFYALVLGCSAVACNLDNKGDDPPRAMLYFPNALALSPHGEDEAARYLYVVNSDFDLRYNAGTVQAYSLDDLAAALEGCSPKPCIIEPAEAFEAEVRIPAFSQAISSSRSGERLFIATRTGESLTYVQADPTARGQDVLRCEGGCGQQESEPPADLKIIHGLSWPEEPVSVIAGELGDWLPAPRPGEPEPSEPVLEASQDEYALVAHRGGQLSLFVEHDDAMLLTGAGSVDATALGATDLAYDATSGLVYATVFVPTSPRILARFGITVPEDADGAPDPLRAKVFSAGGVALQPVDDFRDTRSVVFLPALEQSGALATPNALIAAQRPSALVLADLATSVDRRDGGFAVARVKGTTALGAGASRLAAGVVDGIPIAVIACFESREVALVDLRTMLTRSIVPNLSGPYGVVLDAARKLVYVTDFRSSVIRILDIAPALEPGGSDPVEVVATLGRPRVLQELQ